MLHLRHGLEVKRSERRCFRRYEAQAEARNLSRSIVLVCSNLLIVVELLVQVKNYFATCRHMHMVKVRAILVHRCLSIGAQEKESQFAYWEGCSSQPT
jgi:hypothetical protein